MKTTVMFLVGLILFSGSMVWLHQDTFAYELNQRYTPPPFTPQPPFPEKTIAIPIHYVPASISFPTLHQTLAIEKGGIINQQWILTDSTALYLPESAPPGSGGNTIIYAHNRPGLFGNVKRLKAGQEITIRDQKDRSFSYIIYSIETVTPGNVEAVNTGIRDTLTIFTCDGWADEKRLLIKASLNV